MQLLIRHPSTWSSVKSSPSASNRGNKTNPMNEHCDEGFVILSRSMKGVTGSPSSFSASLCLKNSWKIEFFPFTVKTYQRDVLEVIDPTTAPPRPSVLLRLICLPLLLEPYITGKNTTNQITPINHIIKVSHDGHVEWNFHILPIK